MAEKPIAFTITPAKAAFAVAMITVCTFGFNVVSWVNARESADKVQDVTIEQVQRDADAADTAINLRIDKANERARIAAEKFAGSVEKLTDTVNDLTVTVKGIEVLVGSK